MPSLCENSRDTDSPVLALYKTTFAPEIAVESAEDFTTILIVVGGGGSVLLSSLHRYEISDNKIANCISVFRLKYLYRIIVIPLIK